ncbi:MAG: hypothetical protein ACOYOO_15655, partial [Saprospiraceae bacterium]
KGERRVWFPGEKTPRLVPVFDRYALAPGTAIQGPAIVEEKESTTVAGPDSVIQVDAFRNLVIDMHYDD